MLICQEICDNKCRIKTDVECHTKNECHDAFDSECILPEGYDGDILSQMRLDDVDINIFDLITSE